MSKHHWANTSGNQITETVTTYRTVWDQTVRLGSSLSGTPSGTRGRPSPLPSGRVPGTRSSIGSANITCYALMLRMKGQMPPRRANSSTSEKKIFSVHQVNCVTAIDTHMHVWDETCCYCSRSCSLCRRHRLPLISRDKWNHLTVTTWGAGRHRSARNFVFHRQRWFSSVVLHRNKQRHLFVINTHDLCSSTAHQAPVIRGDSAPCRR